MEQIPLAIIVGPTAVGKTEASINIAKRLDGEIISADSMQIYRHMDIGTAKPNTVERQNIPHHLLDIVDPDENFNVSLYQELARKKIREIHSRGKIPVVVGGTGLYVNSLIYPLDFTEAGEDQQFRENIKRQMEEKGRDWLHNELLLVDPLTANRLHPNDVRRIIRALEVYHITRQPISKHYTHKHENNDEYSITLIGLTMERNKLYDRINQRVDIMMKKGLIDEVKWLIENGYSSQLNSMQGLGYKEVVEYLNGRRTLMESSYILKRDTRRFAKRQYTWFRRLTHVNWIDVGMFEDKDELARHLTSLIVEKHPNKGI